MHTTYMWQPKAIGKPKVDKIELFARLLGFGKDNAVKRSDLAEKCIEEGLIHKDAKDKDRAMRKLLQAARREYVILNSGNGEGYYRPTSADLASLAKSNDREKGRAIEVFRSNTKARALEEDYRHGRTEEVMQD